MARRVGKKLGRTTAHRFALLNSLATALFRNEQIKTTESKAKELKRYVDEIISTAKRGGLSNIRKIKKKIKDGEIIKKIFDSIVPSFGDRQSGFTGIIKTGYRAGDRAKMVIIKLLLPKTAEEKKK